MDKDLLNKCADFIAKWEGFEENVYKCSAGIDTFGYGSLVKNYPKEKFPISEKRAKEILCKDIETKYYPPVKKLVKININDNQIIALTSFCYNLGASNLEKSTLLRKLNNNDIVGASDEFLRWVYAGGKKIQGLINRRESERELFLTAIIKKKEESKKMLGASVLGGAVLKKVLGFATDKIKDKIAKKVGDKTLSKIQQFTGLDLNTAKEDDLENAIDNLTPEQFAEIRKEAIKADVSIEREITRRASEVNKTYRKELDSDIQFVAMARPFNLYALAIAMFLLVMGGLTLCFMSKAKEFEMFVDALTMPLTAWVGVVGVYVNGKSKEKIKTSKYGK